jgi:hypothetical protein
MLGGLGQLLGQSGSETSCSLQRPDPAARGLFPRPLEHAGISRTICRCLDMGAHATGGCIQHRQIDGVTVRITSDDVVILFCQSGHCHDPFSELPDTVTPGPGEGSLVAAAL